jgi:choline dehydrogenase-like flavoprotein
MGLTRMSHTPRDGVVDAECRVHGVRNLFVASSAAFPTGGAVSPTLTIVALAVRIARTVRDRELSPRISATCLVRGEGDAGRSGL